MALLHSSCIDELYNQESLFVPTPNEYPQNIEFCSFANFFSGANGIKLSIEDSEEAVLRRCVEILEWEGAGHTFAIHTEDADTAKRFAAAVPASRVLVNGETLAAQAFLKMFRWLLSLILLFCILLFILIGYHSFCA